MHHLVKISVFIHDKTDLEHRSFEIDSLNVDYLLDMLNSQDIERLKRLTIDSHNQKQTILLLERENKMLRGNIGVLSNKLGNLSGETQTYLDNQNGQPIIK